MSPPDLVSATGAAAAAPDPGSVAAPGGLGGFDEAAEDFATLAPQLWDRLAAATLAAVDPRPGERVLDACCGTGASALPAAGLVGSLGGVDAVDLAAPMVDLLRAEAARRGLAHLLRRCRPGGRAGLTIWRRGAIEPLASAVAEETCAVRGVPVPERPAHLVSRVDEAEPYAEWLRCLGLVHVQVRVAEMHLDLDPALVWLLVTGSGFRGMLSGLPAGDVKQVRDRLVARLDGTVLDATSLVGTGTWTG